MKKKSTLSVLRKTFGTGKKYLLLLILFLHFSGYAQLNNANWFFGDHSGFNFASTTAPTPTSIPTALYTGAACASYSLSTGQFVFYTNGEEVYNANGTPMANGSGLLGYNALTQGAIIIKKPLSTNVYIITLDGKMDGTFGQSQGLRYTEVKVVESVPAASVLPSVKNIPLRDHTGVLLDENYSLRCEKITSAPHCNGRDYWLVTQVGAYIYSYLVNPSGISPTPVTISPALVNIQSTTGVQLYEPSAGQIKISPLNNRIAVAYYANATAQLYTGSVAMGNFNSSNGSVSFDGNLIQVAPTFTPYPQVTFIQSLEFSPNGRYIYLGFYDELYVGSSSGSTSANIQLVNPINTMPSPAPRMGCLQRAINGKIYVTSYNYPNTPLYSMSVINTPNSISAPNFQVNIITPAYGSPGTGLPGWVHTQTGQNTCLGSISTAHEQASLNIYPNPAKNYITLSIQDTVIKHIAITSIEGIEVFRSDTNDSEVKVDVSNFRKGIYIATVVTENGDIVTNKIMIE